MDIKTKIEKDELPYMVSTVLLPTYLGINFPGGNYETCIFWDSAATDNHGSEVVQRYSTPEDAIIGHEAWADKIRSGQVSWRDYTIEY